MDARTLHFLFFTAFGLLALVAGYAARRRDWLHEDASKRVHFHTVIWIWSAAAVLSLWRMPLRWENLWLLLLQPAVMAASAYGVIPLAKALGCGRKQTGVLAIAAAMSNNGFTLGAFLCYSLFEPAEEALAYGMACVAIMQIAMVFLLYPLARKFGGQEETDRPLGRLMLENFIDIRSMPLYASAAGFVLAMLRVPFPAGFFGRYHVLPALFFIGGFGTYFGIGLRLRLGDSRRYWRQHVLLALIRFVATPVLTALMLWLIAMTPYGLDPLARKVFLVESMVPTATMTVILANLFHLDPRMASVTWLWNTVIFLAAPLPVILWWMG